MFDTILEAVSWLESCRKGNNIHDLDIISRALGYLGHPEENYKKIHVAGTNGKGSTVAFLKNILLEGNHSVGTFISPYVVKFNERITLNYQYISDEDLLKYINIVYDLFNRICEETNTCLSFFDMMTIIALKFFSDKNVEYAIIEVGLGGLHDSTNVIKADLSLITNIGYDHMDLLGNTLSEIALQKVGIVKEGGFLITTALEDIMPVFNNYLANIGATVLHIDISKIFVYNTELVSFAYQEEIYDLSVIGIHQAYNATLAIEAIKYLDPDYPLKTIKLALLNTLWPGRLERVMLSPRVLLDGAHNIHGVEALVKTVKEVYKNRKVTVIFSAMKDKDTKAMLKTLSEVASRIIFTHFDYYRAKPSLELQEEYDGESEIIEPYDLAIKQVIESSDKKDCILITGSLYFISIARKYFKPGK